MKRINSVGKWVAPMLVLADFNYHFFFLHIDNYI